MKYDYIIIGGGMGGLSAANFLARYGKKVLVLEKHSIPGGLVTSFPRKGVHFDLGIHGLYELNEGQAIPQFLEFWGGSALPTLPLHGDLKCFIDGREYRFSPDGLRESFLAQFPGHREDVNRIFDVMEAILAEMFSGSEAPEPPYDMNLLQLIRYGMNAKKTRPVFMKYGNKDVRGVLDALTDCDELKTAIYSKSPYPMVFMAFAYQWGVYGRGLYPAGGMQAIPDAAAATLAGMGGELKLNTEVTEILVDGSRACGVRTRDGSEYRGAVISNASPQFTYEWLPESKARDKMKKALAGRKIFDPVAALFLSFDEEAYSLDGLEGISLLSAGDCGRDTGEYTAHTAPIFINIYPKREGDRYRSLVAMIPIGYEYHNTWETGPGGTRGEAYKAFKNEVESILLGRLEQQLGSGFIRALAHHELSTPLTFERYTYSKQGSFMGWSVEQGQYGRFLKQRTPIKDLYLVGQWVFPGFGVAGVMASGYYLAREILKGEGIDVKKDFTEFFAGRS